MAKKTIDTAASPVITKITSSDSIKSRGPAPIQIASEASETARRKQLEGMGHKVSEEKTEETKDSDSF